MRETYTNGHYLAIVSDCKYSMTAQNLRCFCR